MDGPYGLPFIGPTYRIPHHFFLPIAKASKISKILSSLTGHKKDKQQVRRKVEVRSNFPPPDICRIISKTFSSLDYYLPYPPPSYSQTFVRPWTKVIDVVYLLKYILQHYVLRSLLFNLFLLLFLLPNLKFVFLDQV